jgi:hypothetical protein
LCSAFPVFDLINFEASVAFFPAIDWYVKLFTTTLLILRLTINRPRRAVFFECELDVYFPRQPVMGVAILDALVFEEVNSLLRC